MRLFHLSRLLQIGCIALVAISAAGCGGGSDPAPSEPPVVGVPAALKLVDGANQTVPEHVPLRTLSFLVVDGFGSPVRGAAVEVSRGTRTVSVTTGADGLASVGWSVDESHIAVTNFHVAGMAVITARVAGLVPSLEVPVVVTPSPFAFDGQYACKEPVQQRFGVNENRLVGLSGSIEPASGNLSGTIVFGSAVAIQFLGRIVVERDGEARFVGTVQTIPRNATPGPAQDVVCHRL